MCLSFALTFSKWFIDLSYWPSHPLMTTHMISIKVELLCSLEKDYICIFTPCFIKVSSNVVIWRVSSEPLFDSWIWHLIFCRFPWVEDVADAYKAIELELTLAIAYFSNGYDFFINSLYQEVKYFSRFIHLSVLKQRMLIIICDLRKRLSSYMTRKGGWIAQGFFNEWDFWAQEANKDIVWEAA